MIAAIKLAIESLAKKMTVEKTEMATKNQIKSIILSLSTTSPLFKFASGYPVVPSGPSLSGRKPRLTYSQETAAVERADKVVRLLTDKGT